MKQFKEVLTKSVNEHLRRGRWPVYERYAIEGESDDAFVTAPLSPTAFFESEHRGVLEGTSPLQDVMNFYAPLRHPEVVLSLAELAEKEITPEDVREWAEVYGLLGFTDDDTVTSDDRVAKFKINGAGRRDGVRRFAQAAGEVRACLRIYEAVTADGDLNSDDLSPLLKLLPREALAPFGPEEGAVGRGRSWLFGVLGRLIQMRLEEHCYPRFSAHTHNDWPSGRFSLSWGFRGLIGAVWLQLTWLLEAEGEGLTRCKLPDCRRVIRFEPGVPAVDKDPFRRNVRGKYKTRSDREFCKDRACRQIYHYRKSAGWPGYA